MRSPLSSVFASQPFFSGASFFFLLYGLGTALNQLWPQFILSIFQGIGGMCAFFASGFALTIWLQWTLKRSFDWWEFTALSLFNSLLFFPLILLAEGTFLVSIEPWQPFLSSLFLWIIAGILLFFGHTTIPALPKDFFSWKHPLIIILLLGATFILLQTALFFPLVDLDPYKWLYKYTYEFANHLLDPEERPLFGSLTYLITTLTGVSIHTFFKYILPLFLLLTLVPAWLVARNFSDRRAQWIFLLFVFSSPNVILYSGTAMPQAPFIILCYFFTFFLLWSHRQKDAFFLYLVGVSMFLSFFYHQTAFLIFLGWSIPVLISKRKFLLSYKKTWLVLGAVLLLSFKQLYPIYLFATTWVDRIIPHFFNANNVNLLYPAQYSNVDSNAVGWNSLTGVLQFYSYYVGPLTGFILLCFIFFLFRSDFQKYVLFKTTRDPALSAVTLSFFFFFIIAEVLPRYPAIALLPDRAWIFAAIFTNVFLYFFLEYQKRISRLFFCITLLCLLIGLAGTLSVHTLKRYLISPMQLESAIWIKDNLPENRIFLSSGHRSLLPVYSDSSLINIPTSLYCEQDKEQFQNILTEIKGSSHIQVLNPLSVIPPMSHPVPTRYAYSLSTLPNLEDRPLYIYYSQVHTKNPYRSRDYSMTSWGMTPCSASLLFDRYPEQFQRIYQSKTPLDEVIIWQVL